MKTTRTDIQTNEDGPNQRAASLPSTTTPVAVVGASSSLMSTDRATLGQGEETAGLANSGSDKVDVVLPDTTGTIHGLDAILDGGLRKVDVAVTYITQLTFSSKLP